MFLVVKLNVSNSTSFSGVTSKRVLSAVPVTNTSCNINFNKESYSSLSCNHTLPYHDNTSKSFLSTVPPVSPCNLNPNDKSYSSSY